MSLDTVYAVTDMFNKQSELEDILHPGWRSSKISVDEAIFTELSEVLSELQYKWWIPYQEPINITKVHAELIDMWHFILLHHLMHHPLNTCTGQIPTCYRGAFNKEQAALVRQLLLSYAVQSCNKKFYNIDRFLSICALTGLQIDELYVHYIIKHAVNMFRASIIKTYGVYNKSVFSGGDSMWAIDQWEALRGSLSERHQELQGLLMQTYKAKLNI